MVGDNSENKKMSIIKRLIDNQKRKGSQIRLPKSSDKIGFVFSTKDRVEFTLKSLESIDQEKGFDIIWVDGSETKEGKELPQKYQFKNTNLAEVHLDVRGGRRGGRDETIYYGLKRLLILGYDYCGLLENDIVLKPGWFKKLIELFNLAAKDGLAVGAATVRNYERRVIEYRSGYTINWNIGAGMILFSKKMIQLIINNYDNIWDNYDNLWNAGRNFRKDFAQVIGIDLKSVWSEFCHNPIDCRLGPDFSYDIILYKNGLISVGSIPSLAYDLDPHARVKKQVTKDKNNTGLVLSLVTKNSLKWIKLTNYFFIIGWKILKKVPGLLQFIKSIERKLSV